jgi:hypothetical protein
MKPFLSISNVANPSSPVNMTALTSEGGVWTHLQGETGADWTWYRGIFTYSKTEGGNLNTITSFGTGISSPGTGSILTGTWDVPDENSQATPTNNQTRYFDIATGNTNVGIKWVGLAAPHNQRRTFTFIGTNDPAGGVYTATITLSDGTVSPVSVVMNTTQGFTCVYTGGSYDATVDIEIRMTSAATFYTSVLFVQAAYIALPTPATKPTGWTNYLKLIGHYGTTENA